MMTKRFVGRAGKLEGIEGVRVRFGEADESGRPSMEEIPGSDFSMPAQLVLLAMGTALYVYTNLPEVLPASLHNFVRDLRLTLT